MSALISIIEEDVVDILAAIPFSELHGKKLLLTGASGLIGTYFLATLHSLRAKGVLVEVAAVVHSPFPEYLSDFAENVTFFQGDITDPSFLSTLPSADYIVHAAGYGQPGRFMSNPIKTIELNTTSTIALLRKLTPGGKFLFVSTSEVYNGITTPPYREDQIGTTNTNHPRSCYIEGKRCGEAIVQAFRDQGVSAKSARLSLAYGPGTKPGDARVLNSFIYRGIVEKKIDLMDQGLAGRTYCYVSDAVEMLWHILLSGTEGIYNVGGISKTTIADLARMVGSSLSVPVTFPEDSTQALSGAPDDVSLDMTKTTREFSKSKFVSLEEGLAHTIEWQQALYKLS